MSRARICDWPVVIRLMTRRLLRGSPRLVRVGHAAALCVVSAHLLSRDGRAVVGYVTPRRRLALGTAGSLAATATVVTIGSPATAVPVALACGVMVLVGIAKATRPAGVPMGWRSAQIVDLAAHQDQHVLRTLALLRYGLRFAERRVRVLWARPRGLRQREAFRHLGFVGLAPGLLARRVGQGSAW